MKDKQVDKTFNWSVFLIVGLVIYLIIDHEMDKVNPKHNPRNWLPVDTFYFKDSGYVISTRIDTVFYEPREFDPPEDPR